MFRIMTSFFHSECKKIGTYQQFYRVKKIVTIFLWLLHECINQEVLLQDKDIVFLISLTQSPFCLRHNVHFVMPSHPSHHILYFTWGFLNHYNSIILTCEFFCQKYTTETINWWLELGTTWRVCSLVHLLPPMTLLSLSRRSIYHRLPIRNNHVFKHDITLNTAKSKCMMFWKATKLFWILQCFRVMLKYLEFYCSGLFHFSLLEERLSEDFGHFLILHITNICL